MSSPQTWDVRARFVALNPPFQGRSFPIVLFPAVIGRGNECEVFLDAVSISRQHAVVEEQDGRFHIRDLGSRNGIKLADQPVHEAVLNAGDVVTVGDIQLRFEPVSAGEAGGRENPAVRGSNPDRTGNRHARAVRAAGGPRRRARGHRRRAGFPAARRPEPEDDRRGRRRAAPFGGRRRLHPPLPRPRVGGPQSAMARRPGQGRREEVGPDLARAVPQDRDRRLVDADGLGRPRHPGNRRGRFAGTGERLRRREQRRFDRRGGEVRPRRNPRHRETPSARPA